MTDHYDAVIIGTGFAGAFFLARYLEQAPPKVRVLVLNAVIATARHGNWKMYTP